MPEKPMTDEERARIRSRLDELGLRSQVCKPGEDDEDEEFDDDDNGWEDWP